MQLFKVKVLSESSEIKNSIAINNKAVAASAQCQISRLTHFLASVPRIADISSKVFARFSFTDNNKIANISWKISLQANNLDAGWWNSSDARTERQFLQFRGSHIWRMYWKSHKILIAGKLNFYDESGSPRRRDGGSAPRPPHFTPTFTCIYGTISIRKRYFGNSRKSVHKG